MRGKEACMCLFEIYPPRLDEHTWDFIGLDHIDVIDVIATRSFYKETLFHMIVFN